MRINSIVQSDQQYDDSATLKLNLVSYYEFLEIGNIYINSKTFFIQFEIQLMLNVLIESIQIDYFQERKVLFNQINLIQLQNIQAVQINKINVNCGDNNVLHKLFNFNDIQEIQIKELFINNGKYQNNIISSFKVSKLSIKKFVGEDFFFKKTAILIEKVNSVICTNFDLKISTQVEWINEDVDEKEKADEWKKIYKSDDGSRQFISVINYENNINPNIMYNLYFDKIKANFGGFKSRFLMTYQYPHQIIIKYTQLSNMGTHQNGGCLRFEYSPLVQLQISEFIGCQSLKFGGAIYTELMDVSNCLFSKNKGKFGGAYYRQYRNRKDYDNIFENNQAEISDGELSNRNILYASQVFEYTIDYNLTTPLIKPAQKISSIKEKSQEYQVNLGEQWRVMPGILYIAIMEFYLIDDINRVITKIDNIYSGNIMDYIHQNDSSNQDILLSKQVIDSKIVEGKPYLVFQIISSQKQKIILNSNYIPFNSQLIFFQLIDCIEGQQKVFITRDQDYFCQYCPYMMVNHQKDTFQCSQCDGSLFSSCFANYSSLNSGLWRQNYTTEKQQIFQCQMNPSACIGGYGYGNELCIEGRIGIECSSCDQLGSYWNTNYATKNNYQCVKCSEISQNTLKFIFIFIGFILILLLVANSNSKKISNIIYQQYLSKMNIIYIGASFRKLALSSVYIKVLSFNASMIIFIQSQININLKNSLNDMQLQLSNPLEVSFTSIECLIASFYPNTKSIGFTKLKVFLLIPLSIIPLALLFPLIRFYQQRISKRFLFYTIYLIIIYTLFIMLYNSLLSISLDAILCKSFQNGERKSLLDLTISCKSAEEEQVFSIVGLIFYGFLIPFTIIANLIRNRHRLNKISVLFQYGFLYTEYHTKYFYWEIVRFSVKVIQLILSKVFYSQTQLLNNLNILCLIIYLALIIKCQPFSRSFLNKLESISVIIVLINFLGIGVFSSQKVQQNEKNKQSEYIFIGCFIIALLFTLYLSLLIIFSFFEAYLLKLQKYRCIQRLFGSFQFFTKYTYTKRTHKNFQKLRNLIKNYSISIKSINFNNENDSLLTSCSEQPINSEIVKNIKLSQQ